MQRIATERQVTGGGTVGCQNPGDDRLEDALTQAPLPSNLVGDRIKDVIANRALALPHGLTDKEYRKQVATLTRDVLGDIAEKAFAKVLSNANQYILMQSDKHAPRPNHRLPNDFVTIAPDGALQVWDVKGTASGKQAARKNAEGNHNLTRPSLSTTKDGRQLNDTYNLVRMVEGFTFEEEPAHGEGAQSYVVKVDVALMAYQVWEVDADGRIGDAIGPPLSAAAEIAEALAELLPRSEMASR